MVKSLTLFFFLCFPLGAFGFDHGHAIWDGILKKHLNQNGAVTTFNYKALKGASEDFNKYLESLSAVTGDSYAGFSEKEKLAFLMNAYNAFTVKLILDNYPVKSIKDIGSLFKSAWKKKFFKLLGEERHLDWIEHEKIRVDFKEPRIHFAVVCASVGCPALMAPAFTAGNLEAELEKRTMLFLGDSSRNRISKDPTELRLSSIFKWYGGDFEKARGSVKAFVVPYMTNSEKEREELLSKKTEVEFLDYDWSLNETR